MWRTDSIWLDLSIFLFLLVLGHLLLGHFENHRPLWRRVAKVILSVALFLALAATLGRTWVWIAFGVPVAVGLVVIHGWWLPKHGIHGWTGEPREKYLALVTRRKKSTP